MRVHLDPLAVVQFHPGRFQAQALGIRAAADGQQHDVRGDRLRRAALHRLHRQGDAGFGGRRAGHLRAEAEFDPLLLQDALERGGDLGIHARDDPVEEFHDRHLGAQAAPHAAELQPDDAAADDDQVAGNLLQLQRAGGGDDLLFVHRPRPAAARFRCRWQ